jgi:hypothetical protein
LFAVLESLCCGEGSTVDGSIICSLIFLDKFHIHFFYRPSCPANLFFFGLFFIVAQNSIVPFRTVVARETGEGRPFKEEIGC